MLGDHLNKKDLNDTIYRTRLDHEALQEEYERIKKELYNLKQTFEIYNKTSKDDLIKKLQAEKNELVIKLKLMENKEDENSLKLQFAETKDTLINKENELTKAKRTVSEIKLTYEGIVTELREEINHLNDKHKHDTYTQDLEHQRQISSLKSTHALELAQHNEDWERACDDKAKEFEDLLSAERANFAEKMEQIKKIYEEKINEIKNNTIPLEEHSKMLNRLKEQYIEENTETINKLKRKYQEAEVENNKKLESVTKEAKKVQENMEQLIKAKQEALEDSLQQSTKEKNELELNFQKAKREVDWKTKEIAELEETLGANEKTIETERKKCKELKAELKVAKKTLASLEEDFTREKKVSTQFSDNMDSLKSELKKVTEENQALAYKCRSLDTDIMSLNETYKKQLEERKHEIDSLKQVILDQQNEMALLNKAIQERKAKDDQALEGEINKHSETKRTLLKEEEHVKQLQMKLEASQKECCKIINQRGELETKLSETMNKIINLEKQLEKARNSLEELAEERNRTIHTFEELKRKLKKLIKKKVAEVALRKEDIKTSIKEMNEYLQKLKIHTYINEHYKKLLTNIDNKHRNEINELKGKVNETIVKSIEEQAVEHENKLLEVNVKHGEVIKEKEVKINHCQLLIEELETKSKIMNTNIKELETKLQKTLLENQEWKKLNNQLQCKLKENSENFHLYKKDAEKYLNESLVKVRRRNEDELVLQTKERNDTITRASINVEKLRKELVGEVKKIITDITLLKVQYQTEINHLRRNYEERLLEQGQALLIEKEVNKKYAKNLEQLNVEIEIARSDNRELQMDSDEKLKMLNKSSVGIAERYNQLRVDSMKTIETLQEEIKCLREELIGKSKELKESQECYVNLRSSLNLDKSQLSAPQKDLTQTTEHNRLKRQKEDMYSSKGSRYSPK